MVKKRRRRPPEVALYRGGAPKPYSHPPLTWDLMEMTRRVKADDFNEFARYAKEKAGWSDQKIKETWESVHGFGTAPEKENVE